MYFAVLRNELLFEILRLRTARRITGDVSETANILEHELLQTRHLIFGKS
jgi:hypothetical protein